MIAKHILVGYFSSHHLQTLVTEKEDDPQSCFIQKTELLSSLQITSFFCEANIYWNFSSFSLRLGKFNNSVFICLERTYPGWPCMVAVWNCSQMNHKRMAHGDDHMDDTDRILVVQIGCKASYYSRWLLLLKLPSKIYSSKKQVSTEMPDTKVTNNTNGSSEYWENVIICTAGSSLTNKKREAITGFENSVQCR